MSMFKPIKSNLTPKTLVPKKRDDPEKQLQKEWVGFLEARHWVVKEMHASTRFSGFPDLYITHKKFGPRLVEIKLPGMIGSRFTEAQQNLFPLLQSNGSPIWILTSVTEVEYRLLFSYKEGNYNYYAMKYLGKK